MPYVGAQARPCGDLERLGEDAGLVEVDRVVGPAVGVREVAPEPGDADAAVDLGLGRGVAQRRPVRAGGAGPRQAGVDLEVQPRGHPGAPGRLPGPGERARAGDPQVDLRDHRRRQVLVRRAEPGQHGLIEPGLPQREGFFEEGHPEPGSPTLDGGAGTGDEAMAVAVGFDDRHHLRGAGPLAQHGDVVADRVEVDERPRPHAGSLAARASRTASGQASSSSEALVVAPRADRAPARPCR